MLIAPTDRILSPQML
ncbi:hypothetical protein S7711_10024 [Stachybotrys chartarum IBT 7711]|uniref:Uncharacterized protein n=1 Tax=Stachybotrys chartarum (strain CBS 109288 / IBT 7711) TaxID=1280523 RepID=A0A084BAC9_STACB|nr:hypothetical protein S7711_10024 [Stachybotrys chartarum IBT 7711]